MGEPPAVASTAGPPEVVRRPVRPVAGQPGNVPYDISLIFALTHCVGHKVVVQTKTGSEFEGILHTPGLKNADIHIVLRKARNLKSEPGPATGEMFERLIIKSGELVRLQAKDLPEVGSAPSSVVADHSGNRHVVLKDGALKEEAFSGDRSRTKNWDGAGLYGRQLEKWEPDEEDAAMGLEDESSHETGKWDQFKANEKLFGVRTSFNMELYTAKLDASKSRFSVAEADKLAREIAKDPTARNMLADGQKAVADDSGIDEETLFSAVNVPLSESGQASTPLEPICEDTSVPRDNSAVIDSLPTGPVELRKQGKMISDPIPMPSSQPDTKLQDLGKVRPHLTSEKRAAYGSPVATPPVVKDAKNMETLKLTPGAPKPLGKRVTEDFMKFKETLAKSNQQAKHEKQTPGRSLKAEELLNELKNFSANFHVPVPKENKEAAAAAKSALNRLPSGPIKVESQIPAPVTTQRPVTPVADTFSGGPKTSGQGVSHARRPKTPVNEAQSRRGKLPGQETFSRKVQQQDPHMGRPKPLIQHQHQPMHQPHAQGPPHHPPQMQPPGQPHPQPHPQPLPHSQPHPHVHPRHPDHMQGRPRVHPHDVPIRNRGPGHDSYAVRAKAGLSEREVGGRSKPPVQEGYKRAKTPIQDMNAGRAKTPVQDPYSRRTRSPVQDPHAGPVKMTVQEAYGRPRTPVGEPNMTHHRGHTQPQHQIHEVWSGRHPRRPGPSSAPPTNVPGSRSIPPPVHPSIPPGPVHPGPLVMPHMPYMIPGPMPQPGPPSNRMGPMSPRHEQDLSDSSDPMANGRRSLNPYAQPFVPGGPPGSEDAGGPQQQDQKGRGNRPRSEISIDMSVSNGQSSPIPAPIGSPETQHVQHLPPPPPPPPPKMGQGVEPAQASGAPRAPPRSRKNTEKVADSVQHPPDMHPPPPNHMVMSGPMPMPPNAMPMAPPYPGVPGHGPNPGPESERPPMHPMQYIPFHMPVAGMPPMNQPPPPNMVGPPYPFPPPHGMPMFAPMPVMGPGGPMMPPGYHMMPHPMMPPAHPPSYPHTTRPTRPRVSMKTSRRPLQRHNSGQSAHSVHSAHSVPSSHGGPQRG